MAENEPRVDVEEEIVETPEVPEGEEDLTDYRALAAKNAGIAQRYKTKLEKAKLDRKVEAKVEKVLENKIKDSFDYAEKAYLKSEGITKDEFPLVLEVMQSTGKSLDEVLEAKYFQADLKERREAKASKDAIPTGSKRSSAGTRDSVDYHIANKTPLLQIEDTELRRKVLNQRIKQETTRSKFTDHPVV